MKKIFLCVLIILCIFAFLGCNDVSEADNLRKENEDLKTKVDEKQNELDNLKTKVDEKQNELDDLKTEVDEKLSEKENLITSLQDKIKDLEEEIELKTSLFEKIKLDNECIDMLNEIIENGVSLDDYLKFKESNDKIKNDDEIKELFDKIYYYYNKTISLSSIEELIKADGNVITYDPFLACDYIVTIEYYKEGIYPPLLRTHPFCIFENVEKFNVFLDTMYQYPSPFPYTNSISGNNFIMIEPISDNLFPDGFEPIKEYLINLMESNTYVTVDEFSGTLKNLLPDEKYNIRIEKSETFRAELNCDYKLVYMKEKNLLAYVFYLNKEDDFETLIPYTYLNLGASGSIENEQSNVFCYGRVAVYFYNLVPSNNEEANTIYQKILNSHLYKFVSENFYKYKED